MNSQRTVFICINGIRAKPSDPRGWTDEFVTSLNIDSPEWVQAEKFEYYTSALLRFWGQKKRAGELVRKINLYLNSGYRVVLVGHSNGCALIAEALDLGVRIDAAHLFAAAAFEDDFIAAIEGRLVRRLHLYGSADDAALKAASVTSGFLKFISFGAWGYGSLGLSGKQLEEKYPAVVKDHSRKGYGHSTWFLTGAHYSSTMSLLLQNEADDRLKTTSLAVRMGTSEPPTTVMTNLSRPQTKPETEPK